MSEPSSEDLADRVEELEETMEELREELRPARGPLGMPRPPSPRRMLRFTGEYAIPATIAALEANVRALELLQGAIREVDRAGKERNRTGDLGRETLDRLDRALSDLEGAIEEADLPRNAEARTILREARELNADVRSRIAGTEGEGDTVPSRHGEDEGVRIDVEDELDQIREELDEEDRDEGDEEDG